MSELVLCEARPPAVVVTLNRADKRNALSRPLIDAISAAFERANNDPAARCVIPGNRFALLWGEGPPGTPQFVTLHAATSRDGGATWRVHDPLPLPENVLAYDANPDDRGNVWVVLRYARHRAILCLRDSSWQATTVDPTAGHGVLAAVLGSTTHGMLLAWAVTVHQPPSYVFATMIAPLPSRGCTSPEG